MLGRGGGGGGGPVTPRTLPPPVIGKKKSSAILAKIAFGLLLLMLLAWMSFQGETAAVLDQASSNPLRPCNRSKVAGLCAIDSDCRKTIECNSKCLSAAMATTAPGTAVA